MSMKVLAVLLLVPAVVLSASPVVKVEYGPGTRYVGDNMEIVCDYTLDPGVALEELLFRFDGEKLMKFSSSPRNYTSDVIKFHGSIDRDNSKAYLVIHDLNFDKLNGKEVKCEVEDFNGENAQDKLELEVHEKPGDVSLTSEPAGLASKQEETVNEGTPVKLTCSGKVGRPFDNTKPKAHLVWTKMNKDNMEAMLENYEAQFVDENLGTIESTIMFNASKMDNGPWKYRCTLSNSEGLPSSADTALMTVRGIVLLTKDMIKVTSVMKGTNNPKTAFTAGDNIKLECKVGDIFPAPERVEWLFRRTGADEQKANRLGENKPLELTKLDAKRDAGIYECKVHQIVNGETITASSSVSIQVAKSAKTTDDKGPTDAGSSVVASVAVVLLGFLVARA